MILPLFALANAGVVIDAKIFEAPGAGAVVAGVIIGLVVGKAVGITVFSWLAVRLRLGSLPRDTSWPQVMGVGLTAGIGFTVSLFVAELALSGEALARPAKAAILMASALAAVLGLLLLRTAGAAPDEENVHVG